MRFQVGVDQHDPDLEGLGFRAYGLGFREVGF